MKKYIKYFVFVFVILLTGCSSYDMNMQIKKNKNMNLSVIISSDYENHELLNNLSVYKEKLEKYGYSINEYKQDNKHGIFITKYFQNIDDISFGKKDEEYNLLYFYSNDYDKNVENKMFSVDKGFLTNTYTANFYVDFQSLNINLNNSTVTFSVDLPNGSKSDNATWVENDGNKLIWDIKSFEKNNMGFVFELRSYDYVYYGIAVLIAIILVFLILGNLFNKNDSEKDKNDVFVNSSDNDVEKRVERLTNNAINNSKNNNNNLEKQHDLDTSDFIEKTSLEKKVEDEVVTSFQENFNPVNSLVPEISMSNGKTKSKKKKTLFSKFKKNKNKSEEFDTQFVNSDNIFSEMVDKINYNQIDNSSINVNDTATQVEKINNNINYDVDDGSNNLDFPYINDENATDNINTVSNNSSNFSVNNNINLDIDNSFQYGGTSDRDKEDDSQELDENAPVINVNNKSVVVNNEKKEK